MAGQNEAHSRKTGDWAGDGKEAEDVVDAADVRLCFDHSGGKQRFDLRREQEDIRSGQRAFLRPLDRIEERTNADAIAGQDQAILPGIPETEGELALEMLEHPFLILFPHVRNEFGVGMRPEDVAFGFQFLALFGVIEKLAIENDPDRAIFIADGLLAVGQTDDAEAAIRQSRRRDRSPRGIRPHRGRDATWRSPCG